MTIKFDPSGEGLSKVFRDYQQEALKFVWKSKKGVTSREVWIQVNDAFEEGKTISRASIINFLNDMVDEGVLGFVEESGKGGYHRVYHTKLNESAFKIYLAETILNSMLKDFPEETRKAVKSIS